MMSLTHNQIKNIVLRQTKKAVKKISFTNKKKYFHAVYELIKVRFELFIALIGDLYIIFSLISD